MHSEPSELRWRIAGKVPAGKIVVAVLIATAGLLLGDGDPVRLALALLAATGLVGWAVRDLAVPVRLTAGPDGVGVVTGLARRHTIAWDRIESISVDRRGHRGIRSELLEIDAGDSLHLIGGNELGAPPDEVAATLRSLRPASPGPSTGVHQGDPGHRDEDQEQ